MKAQNVQPNSTIIDLDGDELTVSEVWPNQGLGLGCVILGRNQNGTHKNVRYVNIDTEVTVLKSA